MQNLKALERKDKKKFLGLLKEQFGFEDRLDYSFLTNNKNKIFIVNKEIVNIDLNKIRINSAGLYIAEYSNNEVRLSIEGSQIIGPSSNKNILELDDKEARQWMKGNDLQTEADIQGFAIIKHKNDYLGSGKVTLTKKVLNFVSKTRRLNVSD
ncbi:MAG: hypothetical protein KKC75_02915, partial [Nanoarchaeota archaeon]|nr:hypothetical protein [Nanoarchaeota archaeon]MBU1005749.1 hypothetical protein [Nanoarchaeota archaeon]MBU1946439.1 hypothetical protein [Nanoarchaeota archaeon]